MKQFYPIFLLVLLSCSPRLVYVGNQLDASEKVDIYVDETAIKKDFEVMGVATADLNYNWVGKNYDGIVAKKAIQKARECGADAVLFSNYYRKPEVEKINRESSTVFTDTSINANSSVSRVPLINSTGRQILFLKYK